MGKKHKDKHDKKHRHGKHGHADAPGAESTSHRAIPAPLAGIAAMLTQQVTKQLQSPATRAAMATGLRAAADALTRMQPTPPAPPVPPVPPATPVPPQPAAAPPAPPPSPQGTTKAPDPQAIAGAIGDAAELVLGRLFGKRPG